MPDAGCRMPDAGCRMTGFACRSFSEGMILEFGFWNLFVICNLIIGNYKT